MGTSLTPSHHSPPSNPGLTHILTEMFQNSSLTVIQHFSKCGMWFPRPAASAPPETMLEMQTRAPGSGLLNLKLGRWELAIWVLTSHPEDSAASSSVIDDHYSDLLHCLMDSPDQFTLQQILDLLELFLKKQKASCESWKIYSRNFSCYIWIVRGFSLNIEYNLLVSYALAPLCGSFTSIHTCIHRCAGV